MCPPPPTDDLDPERTREDEAAPTARLPDGRLGRGAVLAGKYRLEMQLGQGGMACVWSAYHLELELPVAVKLLRSGPKNEKLAKRLRLEARAAARLSHPSIVRVLDVAVADNGEPFIVMELLSGESLAQLLARERLSHVRAVQLLLPIVEALVVAHAHGIVHRDLKPGNVFLSKDGADLQPKLLDFGIAKLEHASRIKLTDKGTLLGSPNYMSPEQVRGDDVDYRSDIWSFCILLYKALTGTLPFKGTTPNEIMHGILNSDPAPVPEGSLIDAHLAELIRAGLSKDPEQRPRSMREVGAQLAQWLLAQGVPDDACGTPVTAKWLVPATDPVARSASAHTIESEPTPSAPRRTRARARHWLLVAAAAASLVVGTLAWAAGSAPEPPPRVTTPLVAVVAEPLRAASQVPASVAVLPTPAPAAPSSCVPSRPSPEPKRSSPRPSTARSGAAATRAAHASRLPF